MIQKPALLVKAVNMIHELPLTEGDTKGDLYEYLLSKLTTHELRVFHELGEGRSARCIG